MRQSHTQLIGGEGRARTTREALATVRPHLAEFGITRVAHLTGLDDLGIPVAMAVRPNALTLSVSLGKGPDSDTAEISAIMESVETAVAEQVPSNLLKGRVADMIGLGFKADSLDAFARCHPHRIASEDALDWYPCTELFSDLPAVLPWSLVGMDHRINPPHYHDAFYVASDGLASGNNTQEATVHAIYELIERDAFSQWQISFSKDIAHQEIELHGSEHPQLPALLNLLKKAEVDLKLFQMPSDIDVFCFIAILEARHHRRINSAKAQCGGCGCHLDPGLAIVKAISEAAQARLALVAGARDDIKKDDYQSNPNVITEKEPVQASCSRKHIRPFSQPLYMDPNVELGELLSRLKRVGIKDLYCAELDTGNLGMSVVRVVASELQVPLQGHRVQITERGFRNMRGVAA